MGSDPFFFIAFSFARQRQGGKLRPALGDYRGESEFEFGPAYAGTE